MIVFKNRYIIVTERPSIIVGERPGKQRKQDSNNEAFHGNRSGDFVESIIAGKQNIILTNVQQVYYPGSLRLKGNEHDNGFICLYNLIARMNPKHVICLGQYAKRTVSQISCVPKDCAVTFLPHPSWVLRFNKTYLISQYYEALAKRVVF